MAQPWYKNSVTQGFKWSYNNTAAHSGIDLGMPVGTAVSSPVNGVVVGQAGYHDWGGQVDIKFQAGGTTEVLSFLHLSQISPSIKPGTAIPAGMIVGWSGGVNSGAHPTKPQYSKGAHLHMETTLGPIPPYTTYNPQKPNGISHPLDPTAFLGALVKYGIPNDQSQYAPNAGGAGDQTQQPINADTTAQSFIGALAAQVSQGTQSHQLLTEVPGFYGICVALDKAEQFSSYDPGWNPLDVPGYTVQWIVKNGIAFGFRTALVVVGVILLIALLAALVHMNRWIGQAGSLALPLALGATA